MADDTLVIVGAGSSGAVIATRVTENPSRSVTLYEAGPDYPAVSFDALSSLPEDLRNGGRNSMRDHDWGQRFLPNDRSDETFFPRGKVTGGSSAVNTCIALRGQPWDYDAWAELAGEQWSFEACLPAFRRLEHDLDIDNRWHGQEGPIRIARPQKLAELHGAFVESALRSGFERCADHNDPTTTGVGPHAMNKIDGARISTAVGYLPLARARPNFRLHADTLVNRVVFRGRRVIGLEVVVEGRHEFRPARRVVLCAGATNTPGILWRSGIGPRPHLDRLGIEVKVDAPVGQFLSDHPGSGILIAHREGFPTGAGFDPSLPIIQATLRFGVDEERPNEMQLQPIAFVDLEGIPWTMALAVVVGTPSGSGTLTYTSARPTAKPVLDSRLGHHPDDRRKLVAGIRHALRVMEQPELSAVGRSVWPDPSLLDRDDSRWVLPGTGSGYHPACTAPMGPADDGRSVCDGYGRVYGVEGLFVADASAMPNIVSSNLNLPTIMMGERFGAWFRDGPLAHE
ncbi:MAG: GMC family oxidoreductase N-terminal domain-containing protein [Myxococcota bacterium]